MFEFYLTSNRMLALDKIHSVSFAFLIDTFSFKRGVKQFTAVN
jgi:hypothetical protein